MQSSRPNVRTASTSGPSRSEEKPTSSICDLTATDVVLRGKLQSVDRSCAELDGEVTLIELSLQKDKDYCVFKRAAADGTLPVVEPEDYACDPAGLPPR